ncbi:30S ribosomal protein S13 [Candidatus Collierbacteria bacterium RIFOXYB1_FULL_49_13]|uniref:Small ribosomal subunit protein uS13 n=1 Tax=Candidatus Collierbacteria bacterium RIFOXYB1_FULL_49_13 TaxID=1817728 RepID=A0A1F5FHM2_9BACT|nr:MAG: 30S ribosomal protein S13 [Candidatus Collierbacteria bacterium RIFOXYB1_FULL_49_13]
MPRLSGVDIPNNKAIKVALTYIHGIGDFQASRILKTVKIDPDLKTDKLSSAQIQSLGAEIGKTPTEGDLRQIVRENIQRLRRIGSYRGMRHGMRLPSRGQRTHTNARTLKGKRRTVGAMTKEMRQKLDTATK